MIDFDKILSLLTYGWTNEPSHVVVPWLKFFIFLPMGGWTNQVTHMCLGTKFKSYVWVEG